MPCDSVRGEPQSNLLPPSLAVAPSAAGRLQPGVSNRHCSDRDAGWDCCGTLSMPGAVDWRDGISSDGWTEGLTLNSISSKPRDVFLFFGEMTVLKEMSSVRRSVKHLTMGWLLVPLPSDCLLTGTQKRSPVLVAPGDVYPRSPHDASVWCWGS